ncbi:hypothetical protein PQX77_013638 [Marasmius sp. AFHP31]|nr:hypothetical protein PQX77_013638 [Marasmius sp. AFHP31]
MNFSELHSSLRSRTSEGLDDMRLAFQAVINDREQYEKLLEARGDEAQQFLDALHVLAGSPDVDSRLRSSILRLMLRLSERSGLCPNCLNINNVKKIGEYPIDGGGFGDVWKGMIDDQLVCLKVAKVYLVSDMQKLIKECMREAIVWQQLRHPNLLPFLGMYYLDGARQQLCLVSPWMDRGNLARYLNSTPKECVDHQALAYDVASGLAYLHSMSIVHGDLKGVNVLITPDERACITDFGLSRVVNTQSFCSTSSSVGQAKGTIRWLSPELLKSDPSSSATMNSDVYAYACVCYEIFTGGDKPFHELGDGAVIVAVVYEKKHPSRPNEARELTDEMWEIMVACWDHASQGRPEAQDLCSRVGALYSQKTRRRVQAYPALEWDGLSMARVWSHVDSISINAPAVVQTGLQKSLPPGPFLANDQMYPAEDAANTTRTDQPSQTPLMPQAPLPYHASYSSISPGLFPLSNEMGLHSPSDCRVPAVNAWDLTEVSRFTFNKPSLPLSDFRDLIRSQIAKSRSHALPHRPRVLLSPVYPPSPCRSELDAVDAEKGEHMPTPNTLCPPCDTADGSASTLFDTNSFSALDKAGGGLSGRSQSADGDTITFRKEHSCPSYEAEHRPGLFRQVAASEGVVNANKSRRTMTGPRFRCPMDGCNANFTAKHNLKSGSSLLVSPSQGPCIF